MGGGRLLELTLFQGLLKRQNHSGLVNRMPKASHLGQVLNTEFETFPMKLKNAQYYTLTLQVNDLLRSVRKFERQDLIPMRDRFLSLNLFDGVGSE